MISKLYNKRKKLVEYMKENNYNASEIIANAGNNTAVIIKPKPALNVFVPACRPTNGGNMILPAPRKRASVIPPSAIVSGKDSFVFAVIYKLAFMILPYLLIVLSISLEG